MCIQAKEKKNKGSAVIKNDQSNHCFTIQEMAAMYTYINCTCLGVLHLAIHIKLKNIIYLQIKKKQ